jgi:putative serine protease PepD
VDADDGLEDDGPLFAWLPPDDRLWRHPSELSSEVAGRRARVGVATARHAPARTWTVVLLAGVVGALVASGVGVMTGAFDHGTTVTPIRIVTSSTIASNPTNPETTSYVGATTIAWPAIAAAILPSVVSIRATGPNGTTDASGVLFGASSEGRSYVLTTGSVATVGGPIHVTLDSNETQSAKVVGADPLTGLAVLSVPGANRIFATLGSASSLRQASPVMAVDARTGGVPLALPAAVSAVDQQVGVASGATMQDLLTLSTAALPSTEAGGPVVDQRGAVVGISVGITPVDTDMSNLSFAVPVDIADHVAQQLLNGYKPTHPWLGVSDAQDLSPLAAKQLGVPGGAQVGWVSPGSPAAGLGLRANDVITAFDGNAVTSTGTLTQLLYRSPPDQPTPISYLHQGRPVNGMVSLAAQPRPRDDSADQPSP